MTRIEGYDHEHTPCFANLETDILGWHLGRYTCFRMVGETNAEYNARLRFYWRRWNELNHDPTKKSVNEAKTGVYADVFEDLGM